MPDSIATFPLRAPTESELGIALGRCWSEYLMWHGEASLIAGFVQDARIAGVAALVQDRNLAMMEWAESEGIFHGPPGVSTVLLDAMTERHLIIAGRGVTIAAIVMLHNACERFIWRLVRFGIVANRPKALAWIAERKLSIKMLGDQPAECLIDDYIEKWWEELERSSLPNKWDRLVGCVGHPEKLIQGTWHFDKDMLVRFDEIRINSVHHNAQDIATFEFAQFATQLWRAQLVWFVHIARLLKLRIPTETLFTCQ